MPHKHKANAEGVKVDEINAAISITREEMTRLSLRLERWFNPVALTKSILGKKVSILSYIPRAQSIIQGGQGKNSS